MKWLERIFDILSGDVQRGFGFREEGTLAKRTWWWGTGTSRGRDGRISRLPPAPDVREASASPEGDQPPR